MHAKTLWWGRSSLVTSSPSETVFLGSNPYHTTPTTFLDRFCRMRTFQTRDLCMLWIRDNRSQVRFMWSQNQPYQGETGFIFSTAVMVKKCVYRYVITSQLIPSKWPISLCSILSGRTNSLRHIIQGTNVLSARCQYVYRFTAAVAATIGQNCILQLNLYMHRPEKMQAVAKTFFKHCRDRSQSASVIKPWGGK